jgi:L-lactate dehydrogenase complex protein LldG
VQTTVARVSSDHDVPAEVARYLAAENLPAELVAAPDPSLDTIPWEARPLLRIRHGRAEADDAVSLTPCLAAVAETGTLMLASGPGTPTTLNFLPDTHIVVLHAGQVVASYEDGWDLIRDRAGLSPNPPAPPPLPSPASGGGEGGGEGGQGGPPQRGDRVGASDPRAIPRTINLITGPSRTGDIEQRIQLGAHGPRRLHVVLVEDAPPQG